MAHCPGKPPVVTFTYLSPGIVIQQHCLPDFGNFCQLDTLYRDSLFNELQAAYLNSTHAVFGYVDSVHSLVLIDTALLYDTIYYYDTLRYEDVFISIQSQLKGSMPRNLRFRTEKYRIFYMPGDPTNTTYSALIDTPFIAFFNAYDTLEKEMGIGPRDGCFFEPHGYFVTSDSIHKKSGYQDIDALGRKTRMPGVAVAVRDFLTTVGVNPDTVRIPEIRTRSARMRFNSSAIVFSRDSEPPHFTLFDAAGARSPFSEARPFQFSIHDLKGRGISRQRVGGSLESRTGLGNLPSGMYLLRLSSGGKNRTKALFLSGKSGTADTLNFPR